MNLRSLPLWRVPKWVDCALCTKKHLNGGEKPWINGFWGNLKKDDLNFEFFQKLLRWRPLHPSQIERYSRGCVQQRKRPIRTFSSMRSFLPHSLSRKDHSHHSQHFFMDRDLVKPHPFAFFVPHGAKVLLESGEESEKARMQGISAMQSAVNQQAHVSQAQSSSTIQFDMPDEKSLYIPAVLEDTAAAEDSTDDLLAMYVFKVSTSPLSNPPNRLSPLVNGKARNESAHCLISAWRCVRT